jgi:Flp pilus assembly pilin Flp
MNKGRQGRSRGRGDQQGATLVEYAVILALVAAAVIVVVGSVGIQLQQSWAGFNQAFANAGIGSGSGEGNLGGGQTGGSGSGDQGSGGENGSTPGNSQGVGTGNTPPGHGGPRPGQGGG